MKNLIIDFANLASITRYGIMSNNSATLMMEDEEWVNYFLDTLLVSLSNYINVLKSDRVIITLESRSWRKTFYPLYKANRDAGKEEDEQLHLFYSAVDKASEFMAGFTNAKVLKVDEAEGDDIIAVLAQKFSAVGDKTIIVSTDGDFNQLLRYDGVKIFNPMKKNFILNYSHLDYITKLIKGDNGDNVPSTYPRINKDIIESISLDESKLDTHFDIIDETINRQHFFIQQFLLVELELENSLPTDLSDDEWVEVLSIAKERKDQIKADVKQAKADDTYKNNEALKTKDKFLKSILKLAKKELITEARLFNVIPSFREGFVRNKKLICLKVDNIPEHITMAILDEYKKDHAATRQPEFLRFVRTHKLREFAFGTEWSVLKSIKNQ